MSALMEGVRASASFSRSGQYRYVLTRDWFPKEGKGHVVWIMLNPSTATADQDDPTIRRCQSFARDWGYDGITVLNLFALRSTDPKALYRGDPVGEDNDDIIESYARINRGVMVAAWGTHGKLHHRGYAVGKLVTQAGADLYTLGLTKDGYPRHPLYVPGVAQPMLWKRAAS